MFKCKVKNVVNGKIPGCNVCTFGAHFYKTNIYAIY